MSTVTSLDCRTQLALAALTICAAAVLPYLSTANNYFVRDDFGVVGLLQQKPWTYFPRWFVTSWMDWIFGETLDEIRPFTAVSYQLSALPGAAVPWGHHLVNIVLHAANGLMVFALARRVLAMRLYAAATAAIFFVLLPAHTETVAWITGRVDSLPALFYFGSFLAYVCWRQRCGAFGHWYVLSLALFFVALFTKQTAITMVATLVTYDVLAHRRPLRLGWPLLRPYVPFVVMTLAYLGLRYALFGQVIRERQLSGAGLEYFVQLSGRHLSNIVVGNLDVPAAITLTLVTVLFGAVLLLGSRMSNDKATFVGMLFFAGPVWWLIGVAPTLVAAYESPRHVYLASAGWCILLGLFVELAWGNSLSSARRLLTLAIVTMMIIGYGFRLTGNIRQANAMAAVAHKAVTDIAAEAANAPPHSLLVIGVPIRSWEWSVPISLRPPFAAIDVTSRVVVIDSWMLHCCRTQWFGETRESLRRWLAEHESRPVIVMRWHPDTGELTRLTDRDDPTVRTLVRRAADIDNAPELDRMVMRLAHETGRAVSSSH